MVAPTFACNRLRHILRYVFPSFSAHYVVQWGERHCRCLYHQRIVLCVSIHVASQDVEDKHVEQSDDVCRRRKTPRCVKHVLQRRSAYSCLVCFIFCRWRLPCRLTEIFLMNAPPTSIDLDTVVSFDKQVAALSGSAGCDVDDRQSHPFRKSKTKGLVLDAAPKSLDVWLEDVCRWRTFKRDADAAVTVQRDAEFDLGTGE